MNIKYLGNIKSTIRKIYAEGVLGDSNPEERINRILRDFVKFEKPICGSMFTRSRATCGWHVDGYKDFVIIGYPQPTEILLTEYVELGGAGPDDVKSKIANKLISMGKAKLFRPNVGDVYLLSGNVLHRTPIVYSNEM